ncbi:MAG: glucosaminidase domain-containing protein [Pseudohongiellaceae bacterium]
MHNTASNRRAGFIFSLLLTLLFASAFYLKIPDPLPEPVNPAPVLISYSSLEKRVTVPDFASIRDVKQKKQTFFDFLQPFIDSKNAEILKQRDVLLNIVDTIVSGTALDFRDKYFLRELSRIYEMPTEDVLNLNYLQRLLWRVDVIPPSLVLAQAANESAWGTSRFAKEGYNFFGQWCYTQGCGLVPNRRRVSAIHEVKSFSSIEEAVNAYFMNINTFPSYQFLRLIRQDLRQNKQTIDGISLAEGLGSYSERGEGYVQELRVLINNNKLLMRDHIITLPLQD